MKPYFFFLLFLLSCNQQDKISFANKTENKSSFPWEVDLSDTTHFDLAQDYLQKVGKKETVNASSRIDGNIYVTYYSIVIDSMNISTDHSDRIYMFKNDSHFGNILKENDKISPEVIYGIPDKNPAETKEKEQKVMEIYSELVKLALEWKK